MSIIRIVVEIFIAALAVTGLWGILCGIGEAFFLPRQIAVAVVLREPTSAVELDILLSEAHRHPARRRGQAVVLLVSAALMDGQMGDGKRLHAEYAAVAERYGAEVRVLAEDEG